MLRTVVALLLCLSLSQVSASAIPATWKEALYFSYASYCPFNTVANWTCFWCDKDFAKIQGTVCDDLSKELVTGYAFDRDTDTFAVVGTTADTAGFSPPLSLLTLSVIIFRGTEQLSLKNWLTDLSFCK